VRKGLANDFEVVTGGKELAAEHYHIYATSVRNLGTPVFRALFRAVMERLARMPIFSPCAIGARPWPAFCRSIIAAR
jgi:hypothetical protein